MMETREELLQKINELEKQIQKPNLDKSPKELLRIIFFEIIGTCLFAYGIISSNGSDFMISAALFGGIFIAAKFSGGHVTMVVNR